MGLHIPSKCANLSLPKNFLDIQEAFHIVSGKPTILIEQARRFCGHFLMEVSKKFHDSRIVFVGDELALWMLMSGFGVKSGNCHVRSLSDSLVRVVRKYSAAHYLKMYKPGQMPQAPSNSSTV